MVTTATFSAARLLRCLTAAPNYIHEILESWGLIGGCWYWDAIVDFPPILCDVKFKWSLLVSRFCEYGLQMSPQDVQEEILLCWW